MKVNWKKLTALLLAVILMMSLTGLGEDEVTIENNVSENTFDDTDKLAILDSMANDLLTIDDSIDLSLSDDTLGTIEESIPILEQIEDSEPIDLDQDDTNAANTVTLGVSETYKLNTKSLGTGLTYKSSKPKVVSVTTSGTVKGLKKGSAVVSVLSGTKVKKKYTIKVVAAPSKVTLPAKTVTLGVKESVTMTPTIPKNTHTTLTWTNKDATVATVTKAGKITGKKVGNTTITVKTHNGKSATVKVIVKAAPSKVTLNKTSLTMKPYDEFQLKATLPKGSVSGKLTWKSSNPNVVTVFEDGWLFASEVGTATITVKTYNGKKATCKVTVEDDEEEEEEGGEETPTPEPTSEPTLEPTSEPTPEPTPATPVLTADPTSISVNAGDSYTITITYLNDNTISWEVGNSNIATCQWIDGWDGDTCKLKITGLSAGSTTVTVYDKTTQDYVDIYVTVYGEIQKISELSKLLFKTIPEANAMLNHKLTYYEDNMYTCNYFSVVVDSNGVIKTVGFFNNYGSYTLMGQWPGRNLSNAANSLFDKGFELQSDVNQLGTFTHPELPGFKLLLKYSNSKVDYIIFSA